MWKVGNSTGNIFMNLKWCETKTMYQMKHDDSECLCFIYMYLYFPIWRAVKNTKDTSEIMKVHVS